MSEICSRCVMDETARVITFDSKGRCNYCSEFVNRAGGALALTPSERTQLLTALVEAIRAQGRGKRYDCIMGLSGGVDSSYAIVQAVKLGLRPLAVHMDNGWNFIFPTVSYFNRFFHKIYFFRFFQIKYFMSMFF